MSENERRAERAFRALLGYYGASGFNEEDAVSDLLTDLRHLSEQYGWTLDELVERSQSNYLAEVTL